MASPAAVRAAPAAGSPTNPLAQLGQGLWRLLTSVDFAVVQIIFLSMLAVVGMTLQQLPDFAFRSAGDYATAMDEIHARYDPVLGPAAVDVLERLGRLRDLHAPPRSGWPWSSSSSRSSSARSIGRRGCGGTCRRSGSPSRSPSSIRACRTARRCRGVGAADVARVVRGARLPGARGDRRRRHAPRLRRSPPVHEDGDALHPPRADPVPRRRGRDLALRR